MVRLVLVAAWKDHFQLLNFMVIIIIIIFLYALYAIFEPTLLMKNSAIMSVNYCSNYHCEPRIHRSSHLLPV